MDCGHPGFSKHRLEALDAIPWWGFVWSAIMLVKWQKINLYGQCSKQLGQSMGILEGIIDVLKHHVLNRNFSSRREGIRMERLD